MRSFRFTALVLATLVLSSCATQRSPEWIQDSTRGFSVESVCSAVMALKGQC